MNSGRLRSIVPSRNANAAVFLPLEIIRDSLPLSGKILIAASDTAVPVPLATPTTQKGSRDHVPSLRNDERFIERSRPSRLPSCEICSRMYCDLTHSFSHGPKRAKRLFSVRCSCGFQRRRFRPFPHGPDWRARALSGRLRWRCGGRRRCRGGFGPQPSESG